MQLHYGKFQSPVGPIRLVADTNSLLFVACEQDKLPREIEKSTRWETSPGPIISAAISQLEQYFMQRLKQFELPLAPIGTDFQKLVWLGMQSIPYGAVISYRELATRLGKPTAARAVAAAIARNPLPIIIPCQRVVASNGMMAGFASGLGIKRFLLELEGLSFTSGNTPAKDVVNRSGDNPHYVSSANLFPRLALPQT